MSKETQQTKAGRKLAGRITLDMARNALRELGFPADKDASAKELAKAAERAEERINEPMQAKVRAAIKTKGAKWLDDVELLIEAGKCGQKAIKARLLYYVFDVMAVIRKPVPIYLVTDETEGKSRQYWCIQIDNISINLPYEAMQLEAFKEILPEPKKARTLTHNAKVMGLASATGRKPRKVEAKGGLLSASERPSGLYYDTPAGKGISYIVQDNMHNVKAFNSRLFPVLALILSYFHEANKHLIERASKLRKQTKEERITRKIELAYAEITKFFNYSESKRGQDKARDMVRSAAIVLIDMKVGQSMKDGSYRVTNIFEQTESNCGKKKLIVTLSESFAVELVKEGKWLKFWGDALKLAPEHVAALLTASAQPLPLDGSRWRTSELSEILQCLGVDDGGEIHNSLHDDVLQKVHGFIESVEQAGLARCRIMQRMEDESIAELTEKQANFIEGEKRCNVRHSWNDLAGLVLQVELLDPLDADEKSIEEDDKRAIEARRKKLKEEASD